MSREVDRLSRAHTAIEQVLKGTTTGTVEAPRRVKLVDLALQHAEQWAAVEAPRAQLGEVGGSSSPREAEDRAEVQRLSRQVAVDVERIPQITKTLDDLARELYLTVTRLTATVNPEKLPLELPGCRNCARTEGRGGAVIGGHFAGVREDVKSHGLCDWCYRHALADGKARGLDALGDPPPVKACHIFHCEGKRKAGQWMARYLEGITRTKVTA